MPPEQQRSSGESAVSASVPDWSRETARRFWDPSGRLLQAIRRYEGAQERRGPIAWLARKRWVLSHRFWSVITQAEIHLGTRIGGGLRLPHPNGIVIHPSAEIGVNCLIFQQVTIGTRAEKTALPGSGDMSILGRARRSWAR